MDLKKYIEKQGISISEFARRADCCRETIYNILSGKNDIRLSVAIKIEDATEGKVTPRDIFEASYGECEKKKPKHT